MSELHLKWSKSRVSGWVSSLAGKATDWFDSELFSLLRSTLIGMIEEPRSTASAISDTVSVLFANVASLPLDLMLSLNACSTLLSNLITHVVIYTRAWVSGSNLSVLCPWRVKGWICGGGALHRRGNTFFLDYINSTIIDCIYLID